MKWMSVRDFMRGGYRVITEPTVVSNHGRPVGTWFPHNGEPVDLEPFTGSVSPNVLHSIQAFHASSMPSGTSLSSTESATLTPGVTSLPERRA